MVSSTANFTSYDSGAFERNDQVDLTDLLQELAGRRVPALVSNHATEFTLSAYKTASIEQFDVQRFISCDGNNRGRAGEVMALFVIV